MGLTHVIIVNDEQCTWDLKRGEQVTWVSGRGEQVTWVSGRGEQVTWVSGRGEQKHVIVPAHTPHFYRVSLNSFASVLNRGVSQQTKHNKTKSVRGKHGF
jgi:hypothetical protein